MKYSLSQQHNFQIILLGYGKMGKAIEEIVAIEDIYCKINTQQEFEDFIAEIQMQKNFFDNKIVIDFSKGHKCYERITTLLHLGAKIVSGTTAWPYENIKNLYNMPNKKFNKISVHSEDHTITNSFQYKHDNMLSKSSFLHSPNFSIGVNIFFYLIDKAAKQLSSLNFSASGSEIHSPTKKDAPSGTAIKATQIIQKYIHDMPIFSYQRVDNVTGIHNVKFSNTNEVITISHETHSRTIFADGAIQAAIWICNKNGYFEIENMIFNK